MKKMIYISLISGIVALGGLEIYFRFFSNYCQPYFDRKTKIIKRKKNTEGIYKTKNTNTGYFRINNEGWNSHRNYFARKEFSTNDTDTNNSGNNQQIIRIAIIGHSNIEGLRVPVDKTLSKVLEDELRKKDINSEVYTFGFGGMHLAQALHVARYVVVKFKPDILVIGTLLHDFLYNTTEKKNFLNLQLNETNEVTEVLPKKFKESGGNYYSFLCKSKAFKYIHLKVSSPVPYKNPQLNLYQDSEYELKLNKGFDYILKAFNTLGESNGIPVCFFEFPNYYPSYKRQSFHKGTGNVHHGEFIKKIKGFSFPIIRVTEQFNEDYLINKNKFDFPKDAHLNQHAHKLIGLSLADFFVRNKNLL